MLAIINVNKGSHFSFMWMQTRADLMPQVDATSVLQSDSECPKECKFFFAITYNYLNDLAIVI